MTHKIILENGDGQLIVLEGRIKFYFNVESGNPHLMDIHSSIIEPAIESYCKEHLTGTDTNQSK